MELLRSNVNCAPGGDIASMGKIDTFVRIVGGKGFVLMGNIKKIAKTAVAKDGAITAR